MYSSSSDSESETVCMKPNQSKLGFLSDSDSDTAVRKANNSKLACSSPLQSDDELFPGSDDNVDDKENKSESEVSEGEKNNLLTA